MVRNSAHQPTTPPTTHLLLGQNLSVRPSGSLQVGVLVGRLETALSKGGVIALPRARGGRARWGPRWLDSPATATTTVDTDAVPDTATIPIRSGPGASSSAASVAAECPGMMIGDRGRLVTFA